MTLSRRVLNPHASAYQGLPFAKQFREKRPVVTLRRRQPQAEVNPATRDRRKRAAKQDGLEALMKSWSKVRDHHRCQVPGCTVQGIGRVESMHIVDAGIGGRASVSSKRSDYVTGCHDHHQGTRSIHSTHLDMRPRDPELGGDGLIDWYERSRTGNAWSAWRHLGTTGYPRLQNGRS